MYNSGINSSFQFGDIPSGLTPMPLMDEDDDFLNLLQSSAKPLVSNVTTANPADISSTAVLRNINLSSPSTDSSPSPPSQDLHSNSNIFNNFANQDMASRSTRSATRDPFSGEPSTKRKQLDDLEDDSDEDAPQRKQQHTDGSSSKKSASKRKSIGGQDDSRLQKRKEQNRAAQRAFRERKERHVKDLEDKVSILEEKTDSQAAENENLRELLTRLQQENLQLKQTQFNFTFQQPLASTSAAGASAYQAKPANDTNMTGVRPTSNAPSSSTQSPLNETPLTRMMNNSSGNLTPNNNGTMANQSTPTLTSNSASPSEFNLLETLGLGPSPDLSFTQTSGLAGLTPPPSGSSYTLMDNAFFGNTPAGSGASLNDLGFSSSFGDLSASSFAPMPYQTIAVNNMFTSFRDPSENPNAWASFGPNSSQSQSLKNTYDELFGAGTSLSGNDDLNMSSLGGMGATDELMPFAFLPDMSNGTGGSQFGGLSPISHLPTPPSATSTAGQNTFATTPTSSSQQQQQDHEMALAQMASSSQVSKEDIAKAIEASGSKSCPKSKEDIANRIEMMGTSPFAPPAPSASPGVTDPDNCTKMTLADATKLNLDIGTAWRAVRQHPQFEECDIDELCAELAQKATCDGNNKVIEAQKIMDIVHSIPERAKQRKLSLMSRPSAA